MALLAGIALALCGLSACAKGRKTASKRLIQACVVELGLRIDLSVVTHSGNVATMAQSHSTQRRIGRKAIISMVHLRRSGCQRSANFCPQLKSIELASHANQLKKLDGAHLSKRLCFGSLSQLPLGVIYWGVV